MTATERKYKRLLWFFTSKIKEEEEESTHTGK